LALFRRTAPALISRFSTYKTTFVFMLMVSFGCPTIQALGQDVAALSPTASSSEAGLPDAPSAVMVETSQDPGVSAPPRTPRFGPPTGPIGVDGKFKMLVEPQFGPRALFTTAFRTGIRMAKPANGLPSDWHQGAEAYGRLYGDSFARNGAEGLARFSTAVVLHEDPRYRRSESSLVPVRFSHALLSTFVDRTDSGHVTPAVSNFAGAAANGFLGNAYLPPGFNDLTHAGQRGTYALAGLAGQNVLQEFAPELGRARKKLHIPHIPLPPVWWTPNQ
jgi:hypothetical protein